MVIAAVAAFASTLSLFSGLARAAHTECNSMQILPETALTKAAAYNHAGRTTENRIRSVSPEGKERTIIHTFELTAEELMVIQPLVREVASRHRSVEDAGFLDNVSTDAQELPRRLRVFLNTFRLKEPSGVCLISGYPVDDAKIGKTPSHWTKKPDSSATEEEIFLNLCGALLGDAVAWSHQRGGLVCQDLVPVEGHENEMLGSGSELELVWHTEDARYSYRGDYIGLMCLRNPDAVPTTFASIDGARLDSNHVEILFEPHFVFRPDPSHSADSEAVKAPVLYGDPESPYVRFDPYCMEQPETDEARSAMDYLIRTIDENLTGVALRPGECLFIDNYKAVHGRSSFKAKFDGTDRWLKRINIARDLRKSRAVRKGPSSRLIL
ncbi:MAG TPA: guanitoxin biosynthesis L-enduracididine beta-hydroxylase GntD [Rubrobacter sp.]|jgi:Fe(II)/alpha-ketoglutarate-dependent arginine beta-hydroxylase|nr:guanitoxin biosynthesis L-enduracididine beta-hydroxylase GntD [Rubrobacter sp.]